MVKLILFFALFALLESPTYAYVPYKMSLTSRATSKDKMKYFWLVILQQEFKPANVV